LNTNSEVLNVNRTLHNGDILYITAHSVMNFTEFDHCEVLRINSSFDFKSQSVSNLERFLIKSRHHRLTNPSGGYPNLSTPCYSPVSVMYATVKRPWSISAIFELDRSKMEPWEKRRRILVLQPNSSQSSHDCSWEPTLGCRLQAARREADCYNKQPITFCYKYNEYLQLLVRIREIMVSYLDPKAFKFYVIFFNTPGQIRI
jgi:hypothetical protein